MIRSFIVVNSNNFHRYQVELAEMHRDRTMQFVEELGWELSVDEQGEEHDQYDGPDATYVILLDEAGHHLASTRLMPATGRNMTQEIFSDIMDGELFEKETIWESTRFFVKRTAPNRAQEAIRLMEFGLSFARQNNITTFIGVTALHMLRLFRSCGWNPKVTGTKCIDKLKICGCVWEVSNFRSTQNLEYQV